MPITTKQSRPNGYVVLRADDSTAGLKLNDAVMGANNSDDEIVQSMSIAEIQWSVSGTNTITINRGANAVVVLSGSGHHDYQHAAMRLEANTAQLTSNLDVTYSGGTGTALIKVHKVSGE